MQIGVYKRGPPGSETSSVCLEGGPSLPKSATQTKVLIYTMECQFLEPYLSQTIKSQIKQSATQTKVLIYTNPSLAKH